MNRFCAGAVFLAGSLLLSQQAQAVPIQYHVEAAGCQSNSIFDCAAFGMHDGDHILLEIDFASLTPGLNTWSSISGCRLKAGTFEMDCAHAVSGGFFGDYHADGTFGVWNIFLAYALDPALGYLGGADSDIGWHLAKFGNCLKPISCVSARIGMPPIATDNPWGERLYSESLVPGGATFPTVAEAGSLPMAAAGFFLSLILAGSGPRTPKHVRRRRP